jgi:hypothetical protein
MGCGGSSKTSQTGAGALAAKYRRQQQRRRLGTQNSPTRNGLAAESMQRGMQYHGVCRQIRDRCRTALAALVLLNRGTAH